MTIEHSVPVHREIREEERIFISGARSRTLYSTAFSLKYRSLASGASLWKDTEV